MTVAVLLYHATSDDGRFGHFDVAFDRFKEQVDRMVDSGVSFVSFSAANDPVLIASSARHVVLTFDDGHVSNVRAWELLQRRGIRPTAFVVSNWAKTGHGEHGDGYVRPSALREFSAICDFGCHGTTHRSLADLSAVELNSELSESKDFLQNVLGRAVTDMSIPRGAASTAVVKAALSNGFNRIGNSWFDLSRRGSQTINRLTISADRGGAYPTHLIGRSEMYWQASILAKNIKRTLTGRFDRPRPKTAIDDVIQPQRLPAR